MAYLDLTSFKGLTLMPAEFVDAIESVTAGWIDAQLAYWSSQIDSRLAKRYAVPFSTPVPLAVTGWLARIVTVRCFLKRGVDPTDQQFEEIKADATSALAEIKEAADSADGLFDLPLRADTNASAISRANPRGYSEQSPYVSNDRQGIVGHEEDLMGGGSYG